MKNGQEFLESEFLFATSDKIFRIFSDFAVIEDKKYAAIGCGYEKVLGFLDTLDTDKKIDENKAIDIISRAIVFACKSDPYIDNNVEYVVLNKDTKEKR